MIKLAIYVLFAVAAAIPGVSHALGWWQGSALAHLAASGAAILSAGFLLSWSLEPLEEQVSRGFAIAILALITVLPEYVIDLFYAFEAGRAPGSNLAQFAAANMTGANRLLIGIGWPAIVLIHWWHSRKTAVELDRGNSVEITFLLLGSLYAFVIVALDRIAWVDAMVLILLFAGYLWRASAYRDGDQHDDEEGEEEEFGPAAVLVALPRRQQYAAIGALGAVAGAIILLTAEPFALSLIAGARAVGVNEFLTVQWVGPLASETPEIIIMVLLTLGGRPTSALGALISDKINQWTLLVGTLPIAFSLGAARLSALALDPRQQEEFFLTAAQSLFAVMLIARLRFSIRSALILLGLFIAQFSISILLEADEARSIAALTTFAWFYLVLASVLAIANRNALVGHLRATFAR